MFERIDQLLIENDFNDTQLAEIAGVGKSTVSGWRKNQYQPKEDRLQRIAEYFGVSVDWLVGLDDYRTKGMQNTMEILFDSKAQRSKCKELFAVSGGQGRINGEYPTGVPYDFDYESGEYVDAIIHGDSMHPVLMDGDTITIHLESNPVVTRKGIYVVKVDGESSTVKYVEMADGGMWLKAENKDVYADKFFSIQEIMNLPVKIIGTVVATKRKF